MLTLGAGATPRLRLLRLLLLRSLYLRDHYCVAFTCPVSCTDSPTAFCNAGGSWLITFPSETKPYFPPALTRVQSRSVLLASLCMSPKFGWLAPHMPSMIIPVIVIVAAGGTIYLDMPIDWLRTRIGRSTALFSDCC